MMNSLFEEAVGTPRNATCRTSLGYPMIRAESVAAVVGTSLHIMMGVNFDHLWYPVSFRDPPQGVGTFRIPICF
jgi:hypothetical protein